MKNENKSDQVLSCLQKELTCYDELLVKMKKQKEAIAKGDESELLTIIQENDELIEAIFKLDQKIEQAFNAVPKAERENLIQRAGTLKSRIQGSLSEVITLENACRDILESKKNSISDQIKNLRERKILMGKYKSTFSKGSSFSKDA